MLYGTLPVGDFSLQTPTQWFSAVCATTSISFPLSVWIDNKLFDIDLRLIELLQALLAKADVDRITGDRALAILRS